MIARLTTLLLLAIPASAQTSPPFGLEIEYGHSTGVLLSGADEPDLVYAHTVQVEGVPSLRLFFSEIDVPGGGWLDVIDPAENQVQRLTAAEAAKWRHSSAFFNSDTLHLELFAGPGERASFTLSHVLAGVPSFDDTICGADDRIPSTDNRAVRFLNGSGTGACTGWLAGADDCAFSAGHCFPTYTSIGEVNCPPSLSNGTLVHPPLEDQFPIDEITWTNTGLGNDWAISTLAQNNLGESAAALWGFYEMGFFLPSAGDIIRITGFGSDTGVDNQVNQTNTGPLESASGTVLRYVVDTTGGNSGSPVIHEATGQVVGIHTNGGCGATGGSNIGTSILNTAFESAWMDSCAQGPPAVPIAAFTASASEVVEGQPVHFDDDSTGIPTAWSWDFDGDGVEDSILKNPTHTFEDPGLYSVSLTVSNDLGTDTLTLTDLVLVNAVAPAGIPYTEDFQAGLPASGEWLFTSSNEFGSIVAGSSGSASPGSGSPSLTMASSSDGQDVQNDAILYLDLTGVGSAQLSYWIKGASDEPDAEDGLFLNDGNTEVKVMDHGSLGNVWQEISLDVASVALGNGLSLNEDFRVIWRQKDNFTLGTDGHLIDDVLIEVQTTLQTDTPLILASAGGSQTMSLNAGAGFAGEFFQVLGSINGDSPGLVFDGFAIPLNYDFYTLRTLVLPNSPPLSNSAGFLDASGQAETVFTIPAGAVQFVGLTFHHCFITGNPGAGDLTSVSNSENLVILL